MADDVLLVKDANRNQESVAVAKFEELLSSYNDHLNSLLLSKQVDPKEFQASIVNSVMKNPKLLECTTASLMGATLTAAELGLMPNTPFQLANIVPYSNNKGDKTKPNWVKEAQFQIGYPGWIELFDRHPKIEWVDCQLVFENDDFKETKGTKPDLIHNPTHGKRGKRIGAYAVAKMKSGQVTWVFMNEAEIMSIKRKSPGAFYKDGNENKNSPWFEDNDPMGWMWMKCPIKQLAKKLPKTREMNIGVKAQDFEESGKAIKAKGSTIDLDELNSREEARQKEVESRDLEALKNVAESATASHEGKVKVAVTYFTRNGVTIEQLLTKLEISNIQEIEEFHLEELREIRSEAKKRNIPVSDYFS